MEILYISSVPSPQEFYRVRDRIRKNVDVTKYGMNESGFKFHTLILHGLDHNPNTRILSLVGRNISFETHRGLLWRTVSEQGEGNISYRHLGFINLPVIKQLILSLRFFGNTLRWLHTHRNAEDTFIIADAAYVTVIPFVMAAAKLTHCRIAAIFCDIYEYMGNVRDARNSREVSIVHRVFRWFMAKVYKHLDGFILLTQKMNRVVNPLGKPHVVVEGLVDVNMKHAPNDIACKAPQDIIMYAGALREQYGLKNLVEGFMRYENDSARLWIYGAGDYAPAIIQASAQDPRIIFYGLADNDIVVQKEIEATVLINPRPADREFTQYSFPSKNMEYMVSGTPVLTTCLPGMPDEYYQFIYSIDGNDTLAITHALQYVFTLPREELHQMGLRAKQFVLTNKNNIVQSSRIITFLKTM